MLTALRKGEATIFATADNGVVATCRVQVDTHFKHFDVKDVDFILPSNVTTIEAEAFVGMIAKRIVIPKQCHSIGSRAFADYGNFRIIYFEDGDNVSIMDNFIENSPETLIIAPEGSKMEAWADERNVLY